MSAGTDLSDGQASMASNKNPRQRLLSFFGRANYSYADKYMATVSYRREGSSKFGKTTDGATSGLSPEDGASHARTSWRESTGSTT